MGAAIPPVWAGEWYEECIRKGHFLHPNGKIRPFGSQLKHMVAECQSWFNKNGAKNRAGFIEAGIHLRKKAALRGLGASAQGTPRKPQHGCEGNPR